MNKKSIGAILCVCMIAMVVPAVGATETLKLNDDNQEAPLSVGVGDVNLTVSIKSGLLHRGIKITIKNTGEVDAENVTCNYSVTRRGLLNLFGINRQKSKNFTYPIIENGSEETIRYTGFFGFWFIKVEVNVTADGIDPIEKTAKGFVCFRFTRLRRLDFLNRIL